MIVQVIDVHKDFTKTEYTSLVMRPFEGFLGILKAFTSIVISISGFGYVVLTKLLKQQKEGKYHVRT